MPGGWLDLGFIPIIIVVAVALWFWARRRWRRAAERKEEVRRLAWIAAEEAARAEAEAEALSYVVPPLHATDEGELRDGGGARVLVMPQSQPILPPHCAVCYRHTTTRCSRCKAVKYCSGKCQIMHWRQVHKYECRPSIIDNDNNATESPSNLKGSQIDKSVSENSMDVETKAQPKHAKTSSARPSLKSNSSAVDFSEDNSPCEVKSFMHSSGRESSSDSLTDSSSSSSISSFSCSTVSSDLDASDDISLSDDKDRHVLHNGKMGDFSCDYSREDHISTLNHSQEKLKNDLAKANHFVNKLTQTSYLKQKFCNSKADGAKSNSDGPSESGFMGLDRHVDAKVVGKSEDDHVHRVAGPPFARSSTLLASETRSVNKVASSDGSSQAIYRHSTSLSSVAGGRGAEVWLLKPKSTGSMSSLSVDCESSGGGNHSISPNTSSKNDTAPATVAKSSETVGSVPNNIGGLKTSVRRVVQQFKSTHLSKHHSLGPRNDLSQKYKMLFPYDLFVKLYNCDKVDLHPPGLTNCGNSCFANAVLQCLGSTRPLASYLLQGFHTKICPKRDWCFTCELANLIVKAKQGQSPLSPIGILSQIHNIGSNLGHGTQEDAHEFLRYAIDTMQSACLKEETTLIQLIFGGYLHSKIKCTRCQGKSERHERMMDLTVEIDGDVGTLEEALARFTATEILDGENRYKCNRCKSYVRAKKKLTVLEAPNVLTIALKRFQRRGNFSKLSKAVRFPEILDLSPYMSGTDKSPVYSLYAVVVHQGIMNAAFSGHYVCYVKSAHGKWYKTDDSKVKPVDVGRVLAENAYMLFYTRCSPRAPSLTRSAASHDNLKTKENTCRDYATSFTQQKSHHDRLPPYRLHNPDVLTPDVFGERLHFLRTDSSSDNSSLFSFSDEGSYSTESTRNSTSTEEFSDFIFGESDLGRFSWNNNSLGFLEDSDDDNHLASSPWISRGGEGLSYREGSAGSLEGRETPYVLCNSGMTNSYRTLTGESRSKETDVGSVVLNEAKSNVLMRSSITNRESRGQTFVDVNFVFVLFVSFFLKANI